MFCPNCGTKNEDDAAFCGNCGTPLTQNTVQETQDIQTGAQPENTQPQQENVQPVQEQFTEQQLNGQPVQGQFMGQQFNGQPQAGYSQQPPKKPFKVTKKMIAIAAAVLAAVIAIATFVGLGKSGSDYKKTAKKYAEAVLSCDWDKAYDMVNFPESEFLTKDAYKMVNKDVTPKTPSALTVTDADIYSLGMPSQESGSIVKEVTVKYSTPGASQSYMDLYMDVAPKKYMLFFKQYKVSSDSLVSADTTIKVPKGSKLSINGVEVNDSYKTNASGSSSKTQDSYKIPFLFDGTNTVKVTGSMFEDYETTFSVSYDGDTYTVSTSSLKMKEEAVNALKTQAESDLKAIADACLANKEVSAINSRIYSEDLSDVTKRYNYALQDCHTSSKDVKSLTISNIKTNVKSTNVNLDSDDGCPTAQVTLSYNKTGTYVYKSSPDKVKDGTGTETSDYIRYKYVNGTWMIYYLSIDLYIS
ncbi:MAG: zinc-ribbon domain-containing protein [Eubacteriales bacterium]|nr:zinc-ribbon domain-containing protein [Eubacteriales bacterium]